jgi:hypothetical protein
MRALSYIIFGFIIFTHVGSNAQADQKPTASFIEKRLQSDTYLESKANQKIAENAQLIDKAFVKQKTKISRIMEKIDDANITLSVKESLKIFKGMALKLGYRYHVEPSYIGDFYTRQDTYRVSTPINPLEWFIDKNTPWVLSLEPGAEMSFWQQYDKAKDARNIENGYSPFRFPINAERARDNLKPGDLAHLKARLSLNIGAVHEWDILSSIELKAGLNYIVQGVFDVFVFRADANKIRVRLVGRRDAAKQFQANVGVNSDFSIFGVEWLDDGMVDVFQLDEVWTKLISQADQNIFLADYTLNLDYPEVRDAYNELFAKNLMLKDYKLSESPLLNISNPTVKREDVVKVLISNLTKLDEIYRQDLTQKNYDKRRVDRNFAGSNASHDTVLKNTNFGVKYIYKKKRSTVRRDNQMALKKMLPDGSETTEYYFFPTWISRNEVKGAASWYKESLFRSSNMIYIADSNYVPTEFKSIGFYYDYTDKTYKNKEHQNLVNHFHQVLPTPVYKMFDDFLIQNNIRNLQNKIKNIRISSRYFVNTLGLIALEKSFAGKSPEEIQNTVRELSISHLLAVPLPSRNAGQMQALQLAKSQDGIAKCKTQMAAFQVKQSMNKYCDDLEIITENLSVAVDNRYPPTLRHEKMSSLLENEMFREMGPGFLFRLIPSHKLEDTSHFEIKIYRPEQVEPLRFVYPPNEEFADRDLYETILDIQELMDSLVPDMRLDGVIDDLTTRKVHSN